MTFSVKFTKLCTEMRERGRFGKLLQISEKFPSEKVCLMPSTLNITKLDTEQRSSKSKKLEKFSAMAEISVTVQNTVCIKYNIALQISIPNESSSFRVNIRLQIGATIFCIINLLYLPLNRRSLIGNYNKQRNIL